MNTYMSVNYRQILINILDEASKSDKKEIKNILDTLYSSNGFQNEHGMLYVKRIIKKYRPDLFTEEK